MVKSKTRKLIRVKYVLYGAGIIVLLTFVISFISSNGKNIQSQTPFVCSDGTKVSDSSQCSKATLTTSKCGDGICEDGETFYSCGGVYPADCPPKLSLTNFACRRIDKDNIEIKYDVTNNANFDTYVALYGGNLWTTPGPDFDTKSYVYKGIGSGSEMINNYYLLRPETTLSKTYSVNTKQDSNPDKIFFGESPQNIWVDFCIGPYIPEKGIVNNNYGVCYESGKNPC